LSLRRREEKQMLNAKSIAAITAALLTLGIAGQLSAEPSPTSVSGTVQDNNDPIAHYRRYEAAISRGDVVAASDAAVTAWRTGERVWNGNSTNLPGLAFNAAWSLGLANKIAEAKEPARRAVELAPLNPQAVSLTEAQFLFSYANLVATPTRSNVAAYNNAAKAVDNGGWGDYLLAKSYLDGSRIALNLNMPRIARDMVDRGIVEVERLAPGDTNLRTNLLVSRTQSSLQLRQFGQAVNEVMQARRAYGPPKSDRDTNWAALAAWESASRAVYLSIGNQGAGTGSRLTSRADAAQEWDKEELKTLIGGPPQCRDVELKRKGRGGPVGISFPTKEASDGYAGGAIVRASLDAQGKVIGTDILAALPRPSFGTAAAAGISGWSYELPAGLPEQCRYVDVHLVYAFQN
jgi:hypothetical protein